MINAQELADRYAAVWNETDPSARRAAIEQLWQPDGRHYIKSMRVQGYDALEQRVTASHDKNVRDAGHVFRVVKNAQPLPGVVTFNWQMVKPTTGELLATGLEFLEVDGDGRIVIDYQFIVA